MAAPLWALLLLLLSAVAPAQSGMTRLRDPRTSLPTDVLHNFRTPGVFSSVGMDGTILLMFPGRTTAPWLLREGPAAMDLTFGPGGWTAPVFHAIDAGYILSDPRQRASDVMFVSNMIDCGPWRPAESAPVPALPGAQLYSSGFLGLFHNPCNGFATDALMVFDAPWYEGGVRHSIAWSYVRLAWR